jgi:macrolide transport system ATP-binding/permease protein
VAFPGVRLINSLLTRGNRNLNLHVSLDWRIFIFTLALAFVAGIAFGLAPAFQATKVDVAPALKGMRAATTRRRLFGLGHALVVAQIALSLLLVIGAGLFVRTLSNLESIDLGFNRENVLLFSLTARPAGYSDEGLDRLYESLRTRLAAVPGVRRLSLSDMALVSGNMSAGGVSIPGMQGASAESSFMSVGPGFFSTMGIPMVLGREIDERDASNSGKVAVVNEVFAKKYFGGGNPLGRQVGMGNVEYEIVGVAKTARYNSLKRDIPPVVYTAYTQRRRPLGQVVFELRTAGNPLSLANTVRRIVAESAPRVPVFHVTTQSDQIDETISQELTFADLCTAFAALALIIACVGLYGLMAYAVSRRTNEIGIRMALGAQRARIVWMVLREAVALCVAGIAVGLLCAWSAASVVKSFLFGMKPADPVALGASLVLLAAAAILAGYAPAWRAARIDPMSALRHE